MSSSSPPADLTEEQSLAYASFVDITNWKQDPNLAVVLLRSCNWNVETAVTAHFDGRPIEDEPPVPPVAPQQQQRPSSLRSSNSPRPSLSQNQGPTSIMQDLRNQELFETRNLAPTVNPTPPIYAPRAGTSIIQTILLSPLNLGYKVFNTVLYFLSWLFPFFPRLTGYYPANRTATHTGIETGDYAKNAAARFIRSFEDNYGVSSRNDDAHSLPFFLGGYTEALEKAKKDLKYLVVVLQSEHHDLTADFNRNVLLSREVVDLLSREDIIFWAGNVKESEAYQVASGLEVTKFPFSALIAPSPRTPTSSILVMTVLSKLQGATLDANEFVSEIEEKMEAHSPKILALVLDKQERDSSRRLREEQDSAYQKSLQADRERLRKIEEEAQKAREEATRKEKEENEEKARDQLFIDNKNQWRQWRALKLKEQLKPTTATTTSASSATSRPARISLRLLSGERIIQLFSPTDTLEDVYAFVECYDLLKEDSSVDAPTSPPPDFKFTYNFQLSTPMPRKTLSPSASAPISAEPSIYPSGSIIVEPTDDDDDDDE